MSSGRPRWDGELKDKLAEYYDLYKGDIPKIAEAMDLSWYSIRNAVDRFIKPIPSVLKYMENKRNKNKRLLSREI